MPDTEDPGRVRSERIGRVLKITIDRPQKKNAFSPTMMRQLSDALTELDRDEALWVGVVCAAGGHFTAGLDMPAKRGIAPLGGAHFRYLERAGWVIAANAPLGVQVTKEAGRRFIEAGEAAAIAAVPAIRQRVLNTADAAEGIRSFVERRGAVFQGR